MPKEWSKKDERQYEHVKKSEKEQGRSKDRAEEIAARTVNKQRSEEGRTKSSRKKASKKSSRKKAAKKGSRKKKKGARKSRSR